MNILRTYTKLLNNKPLLVTSISTGICYCAGDMLAQHINILKKNNEGVQEKYNNRRTINMTIFGLSIGGPLYYIWFKKIHNIDKIFEKLVKWNYERQLKSKLVNSFSKHIKDNKIDNMSMKDFRDTHQLSFDAINNNVVFRSKTILAGQVYADQFIFSAIYPVIFMMTTGMMIDNTKEEDFDYIMKNRFINIEKIKTTFNNNWENVKNKYITIYSTDCAVWPLVQIANFAFIPSIYQPIFVNIINIFWNAYICFISQGH